MQAEEQHANILHTDHDSSLSHKAYLDYFNAIKETLIQLIKCHPPDQDLCLGVGFDKDRQFDLNINYKPEQIEFSHL